MLEQLIQMPGKTAALRMDNGTEFTSIAFASISQVREITEAWIPECNEERPHDSLGCVPH